jgi:hypothetical protein
MIRDFKGVRVELANSDGKTPRQLALEIGQEDVQAVFQARK